MKSHVTVENYSLFGKWSEMFVHSKHITTRPISGLVVEEITKIHQWTMGIYFLFRNWTGFFVHSKYITTRAISCLVVDISSKQKRNRLWGKYFLFENLQLLFVHAKYKTTNAISGVVMEKKCRIIKHRKPTKYCVVCTGSHDVKDYASSPNTCKVCFQNVLLWKSWHLSVKKERIS